MSRYDLTDSEWRVIEPLLPNKPRGVPRVDDRRVLNGIFWVLRSGAPWRDLPERYGPRTTCYNRFVRWRKAGVWDRLMDAQCLGQVTSLCGLLLARALSGGQHQARMTRQSRFKYP
jgi:transposase